VRGVRAAMKHAWLLRERYLSQYIPPKQQQQHLVLLLRFAIEMEKRRAKQKRTEKINKL
jgi:hypothetical protein